jgi:hypothetical protein
MLLTDAITLQRGQSIDRHATAESLATIMGNVMFSIILLPVAISPTADYAIILGCPNLKSKRNVGRRIK